MASESVATPELAPSLYEHVRLPVEALGRTCAVTRAVDELPSGRGQSRDAR